MKYVSWFVACNWSL
ncbi:hypothetical protein EC950183_0014, partial [Escherichia coli 95.0183]